MNKVKKCFEVLNIKEKEEWIALCQKHFAFYGLNTDLRICHFLAQIFHETLNLTKLEENLFYSKQGLLDIFKKYFNEKTAVLYQKKPQKIGNRVYANRMGNGDEKSGDGYKFRGRGCFHLTGKENYRIYGGLLKKDLVNNPDLACKEKETALLTACQFWSINNLNKIADENNLEKIRKVINGGKNGLEDCKEKFEKLFNC